MFNLNIIKKFLPQHYKIDAVRLEDDQLIIKYTVRVSRAFSLATYSYSSRIKSIKLWEYQNKLRQDKLGNLGI